MNNPDIMRIYSIKTHKRIIVTLLAFIFLAAGGLYVFWVEAESDVGIALNFFKTRSEPEGTLSIETTSGGNPVRTVEAPPLGESYFPASDVEDWPSYNRTLTSERFSPLRQINTENVRNLRIVCTYDTKQHVAFETGMLVINGAMIGTTEKDIFSIDPRTCKENWRTHESYKGSVLSVNRGPAYLDGRLFRGTIDGRVLAYDFATGKRLWETTIANAALSESVPAAPIAWGGLVFVGNAGGDRKGIKGRMYALDAKSGRIVWEYYLVPKSESDAARAPQGATPLDSSTWENKAGIPISGGATWTSYTLDPASGLLYIPVGNPAPDFSQRLREGENLYTGSVLVLDAKTGAYRNHYKLMSKDWHDWDISTAPSVIKTRGGKQILSVAPKDGNLYAIDLTNSAMVYRVPVTRQENTDVLFAAGKPVHFCPGAVGGAEWNGPAYDPQTNLIYIGEVEWCAKVTMQKDQDVVKAKSGDVWMAMDTSNPFDIFGVGDPPPNWGGWAYGVDADTGTWKWRAKSNYPILGGVTPTAGGLVFFGDVGGNFYALDANNGTRLWGTKFSGAIGGGVITYAVGGHQRVAVATGFGSITWPTEVTTGKIVILGLEGGQ